ncbi:MAG TPA: ATP synthase F0 subunit B [Polyangiaceae bacterium]|nr:ATP synthase F0 subunit B [Polyangiaceae bacterium]
MIFASIGAGLVAAAVAPQAINVDLDLSVVVQAVLFVALTVALKPLMFDPMLKLFEEREKRIDGAKVQARRIDEKSATALDRYETEMARARAAANAERDRIRAEGLAREQQILSTVRATTAAAVDAGKRAAHAEAERVRARLKIDAADMARDLAARVLGREVQP